MSIKQKILATVAGGLAVAGLVAATIFVSPQPASAQTQTPPAQAQTQGVTPMRRGGPGELGGRGIGGPAVEQQKYLADALGITTEALQAAHTKAHEAAIQQAVKDGLITQAQADAMLNKTGAKPGVRVDLRGADLERESFLANALGITVEKLQAAQATAAKAELAQAVTDGRITQAQADQITAERALAKYIADKGLVKSAVDSAVKDGVITQAQADALLSKAGGKGFLGGLGGPAGRMGRGR